MQDDCFSNLVQDFLVCTTVHKARHLGLYSIDTMVRVSLDKMTKSTKSFPNSENPYYNEYFVFQLRCTLNELLRKTVNYELRKITNCKCSSTVHGELLIDLSTVWAQQNRFFFKKWGRLEEPLGSEHKKGDTKHKGYLQIDLAIITESSNTDLLLREAIEHNPLEAEFNRDYDDIKHNMLTNIDPKVECNIRYTITFYHGFFTKKSDYYIQFTFHPFKGRTKVIKSSEEPAFNEYISFIWTFPSVTQTFVIQIFSHEMLKWKCIAEYELHFNEIAFKDKPKLGPTHLHFYDISNPTRYVGRLLLEIRSECLSEKVPPRDLVMGKVVPSDDSNWWQNEIFSVEFLALHGDFLHGNYNNYNISMKLAEHTSNSQACNVKLYTFVHKVVKKLRNFQHESPFKSIQISAELPDNRHKYDSDYFIQEVIDLMKSEIEAFKLFQIKYQNQFQMQRKCLRTILLAIQSKIKDDISKKRLEYTNYKDPTPWDTNRLVYLQEVMRIFPEQLRNLLQTLKNADLSTLESTMDDIIQQLLGHYKSLLNLLCITRVQDDWPELFLILSAGNKEIGMCRINPKYFLNTPLDKELSASNSCWCVRHFVFKDINCKHTCHNCGCIAGIVQGCLGIVAESEQHSFLDEIYEEWTQPEKFYYYPATIFSYFKCRIFIYQAKVRPGHDKTGLCDAFARVLFNGVAAETMDVPETLAPTWNVVISFDSIRLPGCIEWYQLNPPVIAMEIYDIDKNTANDYLGCGLITTSVISREFADKNNRDEIASVSCLRKYQQLKHLSPPPMKWIPISVDGMVRAEVLASAELVQITNVVEEKPTHEPSITLGIPMSIRPNMKNFVLEVVFAGFRNYIKCFCGRHRVKIMMGDLLLCSGLTTSRMRNSINFLVLYASGVVNLPEQLEYWPTIIATDVIVSGSSETTIGAMIIPNSKRYLQKNKFIMCMENDNELDTPFTTVLVEGKEKKTLPPERKNCCQSLRSWFKKSEPKQKCLKPHVIDESEFTWWTKFYNSVNKNTLNFNPCKHYLTIFNRELERYPEFSYMHDWAEPIVMVHGIKYKKNSVPKEEIYATLKLHIKITPCHCDMMGGCGEGATLRPLAAALNPEYQAKIQALGELCKIIVRVYIVQGINFRPRDKNTASDAYVKVRLGSKSLNNRAYYMPNQCNPVFGKCFELEGLLPRDHLLEVSVYDHNFLKDDIIGSTIIDIEDRWRTKHRATIGIPNEYSKSGYNEWRDIMSPFELLNDICVKNNIRPPKFVGNKVIVDGETFTDDAEILTGWYDEEIQQRLSLTVLKNFDKLPSIGYKLVPEHVESRSLFRANSPGIEQGKIQLWVELYECNVNIPPPIDITPLEPESFELRVVILNCEDITPDEKNIFGTKMSDLFVRCWCNDFNQSQVTDTHYRSLNGQGNFNWRMIFQIKYSHIEDMMICKRKAGILEEYETKQPPILYVQVWDNDLISRDDFLGALEINLSNFPEPYPTSRSCNEVTIEFEKGWRPLGASKEIKEGKIVRRKAINLFQEKKIKGWFPLRGSLKKSKLKHETLTHYAGKIELALEILTEAEAISDPAGMGRQQPNALPMPSRPDMSFNPYLHPCKATKYILWPIIRKYGLILIIVVLVILTITFAIMNLPYILMFLFLK